MYNILSYNPSTGASFNPNQLEALAEMLGGGQNNDNDPHIFGSALNPSSLHHGDTQKELAKPGVKLEVTLNNRNALTGGAIIKKEDEEDKVKQKKQLGKDIWTDEEINI